MRRVLPAALLCTALSICLAGQSKSQFAVPADAEIRTILANRIDVQKKSDAIVVGIITPAGQHIVRYGRFDTDNPRIPDGDSVYEIGSASKVFTSLLLCDMVERGEVKLSDPVSKYLPKSVHMPTRNGREITLIDLAQHVSGLPRLPTNMHPKDVNNPYADYTVQQMYDFLSNYQLTRDIGEQYEYSNLGVGLLGHVLALHAGTDYETLLKNRITVPLRMKSTAIHLAPGLHMRLVPGHDSDLHDTSNWDIPTLAGAGAIRSTGDDLLKFLSANMGLTHTNLQPAMKLMLSVRRPAMKNVDIAIGWHIIHRYGDDIVWHNGGTGGYHSFVAFDPKKQVGVVVLSNSSNSIDDIGLHILDEQYALAEAAK